MDKYNKIIIGLERIKKLVENIDDSYACDGMGSVGIAIHNSKVKKLLLKEIDELYQLLTS